MCFPSSPGPLSRRKNGKQEINITFRRYQQQTKPADGPATLSGGRGGGQWAMRAPPELSLSLLSSLFLAVQIFRF